MLCIKDNEKKLMESEKLREIYEEYFGTVYSIYELAKARTRNMTFEESIKETAKLSYEYLNTGGHPDKFFRMSEKKAQRFATRQKKSLEKHLSKQSSKTNTHTHSEDSDSDSVSEKTQCEYKPCGGKGVCRKNIRPMIKLSSKTQKDTQGEEEEFEKQKTALPSETSDNE